MDMRLRLEVRRRAADQCEYCRIPAEFDRLPFQVDHIVPLKHAGETRLDNLAWSCFDCNVFKGPNLAGIDPNTGFVEALFNPRIDDWRQHFRWDGPLLVGETARARATIEVLRLNLPTRVEHRRMIFLLKRFE